MATKMGVIKKFGAYGRKPLFKSILPRGKSFSVRPRDVPPSLKRKDKGISYFYLTDIKT